MKLHASSFFGADFALVIVLAAMLAVGIAALATPARGAFVPATGAGTRIAVQEPRVVHYRVDVIGVRESQTADGGSGEATAQPGRAG